MIKRCRMKERFRMKNGSNEIAYILRGLKFAPIKYYAHANACSA